MMSHVPMITGALLTQTSTIPAPGSTRVASSAPAAPTTSTTGLVVFIVVVLVIAVGALVLYLRNRHPTTTP